MGLKSYIVGGLTVLAIGGCAKDNSLMLMVPLGRHLKGYVEQPNGLVIPTYNPLKGKIETGSVDGKIYTLMRFDRNKDLYTDLVAVDLYNLKVSDKPSLRHLWEDRDFDGSIDVLFADYGSDDAGLDGTFDVAYDAEAVYWKLMGKVPEKKDLNVEAFIKSILGVDK